jgi:hypothetical protein
MTVRKGRQAKLGYTANIFKYFIGWLILGVAIPELV